MTAHNAPPLVNRSDYMYYDDHDAATLDENFPVLSILGEQCG